MPRSDAKLKNLPEEIQEEMWRLRTTPVNAEGEPVPPKKGSPWTQEFVRDWLEVTHGVSSSSGAFSAWEKWYQFNLRSERAKERAAQAKMEAAKDPDFTAEDLDELGQTIFTSETIDEGNIKYFVQLQKLRIQSRKLDLNERRIQLLESKAERLDAAESKAKELRDGGGLSPETLEVIEKQLKLL